MMGENKNIVENKKPRGGKRAGAGRPRGDRAVAVTIRISEEAAGILGGVQNKSGFIDNLIKRGR